MLRIYDVGLEVVRRLRKEIESIGRRDTDLARQLRRSSTSIPLNIAEGSYSRGGNRNARYHDAMASAGEALATLHAAKAAGYIAGDERTEAMLNRIIGTLRNVVR